MIAGAVAALAIVVAAAGEIACAVDAATASAVVVAAAGPEAAAAAAAEACSDIQSSSLSPSGFESESWPVEAHTGAADSADRSSRHIAVAVAAAAAVAAGHGSEGHTRPGLRCRCDYGPWLSDQRKVYHWCSNAGLRWRCVWRVSSIFFTYVVMLEVVS